jgi:hypothetical protein
MAKLKHDPRQLFSDDCSSCCGRAVPMGVNTPVERKPLPDLRGLASFCGEAGRPSLKAGEGATGLVSSQRVE